MVLLNIVEKKYSWRFTIPSSPPPFPVWVLSKYRGMYLYSVHCATGLSGPQTDKHLQPNPFTGLEAVDLLTLTLQRLRMNWLEHIINRRICVYIYPRTNSTKLWRISCAAPATLPPLAGPPVTATLEAVLGLLPHHWGRPEVSLSSEAGPAALEPGLGEASACQPRWPRLGLRCPPGRSSLP